MSVLLHVVQARIMASNLRMPLSRENTYRERLCLAEFLNVASNLVTRWSNERDDDGANCRKPFSTTPSISMSDYKTAHEWLRNRIIKFSPDRIHFYARSDINQSLTTADMQEYKQSISSLNFRKF